MIIVLSMLHRCIDEPHEYQSNEFDEETHTYAIIGLAIVIAAIDNKQSILKNI